MQDNNLELFTKGEFEEIDDDFLKDGQTLLKIIENFQEKYGKKDTDTILNELHDSMVAKALKFNCINTKKHGMDGKIKNDEDLFLESKVANKSASTITATFNDTTLEKANAFKDKKVYLALGVFDGAKLSYIVYGQNEKIGAFLEEGVKKHERGETVRSSQSISQYSLVFDYGFKILSVEKDKDAFYDEITQKLNYKNIKKEKILDIKSFKSIKD